MIKLKGALNNGPDTGSHENHGQSGWQNRRQDRRSSKRTKEGADDRTSSGCSADSVAEVAHRAGIESCSKRTVAVIVKDCDFEEKRANNFAQCLKDVDCKIDKTTQRILRQYAANPSRADELSELRERIGRLNFMRSEFMAALAGVGDWIARNGGASLAHMLREGKENGLDYDLFMGSLAASTFPRETLGVCILPRLAMPETTTDTVPVRHVVTNAAQNNTNK